MSSNSGVKSSGEPWDVEVSREAAEKMQSCVRKLLAYGRCHPLWNASMWQCSTDASEMSPPAMSGLALLVCILINSAVTSRVTCDGCGYAFRGCSGYFLILTHLPFTALV